MKAALRLVETPTLPRGRVKLDHRLIDATRPPSRGQIFLRDSEIVGLALRLTAGDARTFVFEVRVRGRMRRITLGAYPALPVAAARNKATTMRAAIIDGRDPAEERQEARREATFADLAHKYIERHAKPHRRSWPTDEGRLKRHLSGWNARRLSSITSADVERLKHAIAEASGPVEANRTLSLLRTMFGRARLWGLFKGDSPTLGIKLFPEQKRDRFLGRDELKRVLDAIAADPNPYWQGFFKLSLLLGTRKGELLSARWDDIDLKERVWRIPTTKSGRPHRLPLPGPAMAILLDLPSRGASSFVFPSWGSSGHLAEAVMAWSRIRERAKVPDVRIHDLRRTLGSWLAASGFGLPLIGRVLNHTSPASTAIYARMDLEPLRDALEANARRMVEGH